PGSEFSAVVVFILFWVLCRGGCVPADAVQPDIAPAIAPPATALAVMAPAACAVLPRNARLVGGLVEWLAGSTAGSMIGSVAWSLVGSCPPVIHQQWRGGPQGSRVPGA